MTEDNKTRDFTLEDKFNLLKNMHNEFQEYVKNIKFNDKDLFHFHLMSLYGSILEFTTSSIFLLENNLIIGVPALIRSTLEGYVDLINILFSESYSDYAAFLDFDFFNSWMEILEEAENGSPNLVDFASDKSNLTIAKKMVTTELENLKKIDVKKGLSIKKKFEVASMISSYKTHYNRLCCDSHNNRRALLDRHLKEGFDGKHFPVIMYKKCLPEHIGYYIQMNTLIFFHATKLIHECKYFSSTSKNDVEKFWKKIQEIYPSPSGLEVKSMIMEDVS